MLERVKKRDICDFISHPATNSCKNGKYLVSIIGDSVINCDEIVDAKEAKTITTNLMKKIQSIKNKISIFYLTFLLSTIVLLVAVAVTVIW